MTLGEALRNYTGTNPFILDIRRKAASGTLTERQVAAVTTALRREREQAQAKELAAGKSFASIVEWLAGTAQHLQFPKFHFVVGDEELVLRFKRLGKRPGTVDITTHERFWNERFEAEMPRWFGRIETDGSLTAGGQLTMSIEQALERIATDPLRAAVEFGRLTNRCAFCRRDLNTRESVTLGYGPVCARKHGLEHGRKAADAKLSLRERLGVHPTLEIAPGYTAIPGDFRLRTRLSSATSDTLADEDGSNAFAERERQQEAASFMWQSEHNGN